MLLSTLGRRPRRFKLLAFDTLPGFLQVLQNQKCNGLCLLFHFMCAFSVLKLAEAMWTLPLLEDRVPPYEEGTLLNAPSATVKIVVIFLPSNTATSASFI